MYSFLPWLSGILFFLAPVYAEAVTVAGRVVDENDAGVAGARVSLKSSNNQYFQTVAGPTGRFTIELPATGLYLVSAENQGYFPLKDHPVEIGAVPHEIHLALNHQRELFQSINVRAEPPPLDIAQTSSQRTLSGLQIVDVPYPSTHSLRNAMKIMPGVVQDTSGGLHFSGGQEDQVLYTLDGFDISDPLTGRFDTHLSVDSVRSLDYSAGRYSPQFGKGSAGALAIRTDMGDDRFRYHATNFVPGVDSTKGLHLGTWSPRLGFSGPIKKGRAWYAESLDAQYSTTVVPDLPKGQDRTTSLNFSNLLHGQINLTPANILYTDFLVNSTNAPNTGLSALDPMPTTIDHRSRVWFYSLKDQIYLGRGTLLEVGFAQNRTFGRLIPQGPDLYVFTPYGRKGNYFVDSTQTARRDQLLANLYLPSFQLAGRHQLKVGTDLDRLNYNQDIRRTGYEEYGVSDYLLRRTTFAGSGELSRPNVEISSYVVDNWRLKPNLTLEYGLRQDWDEILRHNVLSPRISVAWSPFGWKDTKISGGYAVIYDATNLQLFTRPQDQYSLSTLYNPDGSVLSGPAVAVYVIQNPNLKPPRSQNWSLGLQHRLRWNIDLGISLLRRRTHDGLTYINTLGPNTILPPELVARFQTTQFDGIYNLTNYRRDKYDSAQISVHQQFGEQYEWMASYTKSRATSNAVINFNIDQPLIAADNMGPMPWDTPNRFLSWAYLPTPWKNWAVAYLLETRSGFPFSIQHELGDVVGPVNSYRFPAYFSLNLHLERRFRFHGYRFALRGGINNITGHVNPTVVNNTIGSPQFMQFFGSEGRHVVFRIRWLGKESP